MDNRTTLELKVTPNVVTSVPSIIDIQVTESGNPISFVNITLKGCGISDTRLNTGELGHLKLEIYPTIPGIIRVLANKTDYVSGITAIEVYINTNG